MCILADVTYLLPIRRTTVPADDELPEYLAGIAEAVHEVIVVDGSPAPVFEAHARAFNAAIRHVRVDRTYFGANGKVAGVQTGMAIARTEYVIIADDDVRYSTAGLRAVAAVLEDADVVRPQNFFEPLPWHALLDEGRSLIARATGGDWPGTLGVRHSTYMRAGGYNPDVLFENLELVRTIRAAGGSERLLESTFIARRPPTIPHYLGQRVRQAYDELARPLRLGIELSLAPATAVLSTQPAFSAQCFSSRSLLYLLRSAGGAAERPDIFAWRLAAGLRVDARAGCDELDCGRSAVSGRHPLCRGTSAPGGNARADSTEALSRGPHVRTELSYLECAWLNPFDDDVARAHSQYCGCEDGELTRYLTRRHRRCSPRRRIRHCASFCSRKTTRAWPRERRSIAAAIGSGPTSNSTIRSCHAA